ncbi:hypothetical protein [Bifidobacterium indicum]|uniref:hypothetical protein n=1 Tax=Bifidobacterium indicum TaxID=1691 RepID=UPI0030DAE20F
MYALSVLGARSVHAAEAVDATDLPGRGFGRAVLDGRGLAALDVEEGDGSCDARGDQPSDRSEISNPAPRTIRAARNAK